MKSIIKNLLLFFAALTLGFAFTMQFRAIEPGVVDFITPQTIPQMENELHNYRAEIEGMNNQLEGLKQEISAYQKAMDKQGNINEIMEKQLLSARGLAGLTNLQGPGIEVILNDSNIELPDGNDPNLYLVHDEDILTVVSELKAAGAEAISINGQRIMYNSEIRCGGPTINVNSMRYAPPYIIYAIGDPTVLYGYLKGPERGYLDILEYYGLQVKIRQRENIVIPAYKGIISLKHVKTYKEGE